MAEIVRDLGQQYGDLGSSLVRHQGKWFVISGTSYAIRFGGSVPEWGVFPGSAHGAMTSWRDLGTHDSRGAALAALEDTCHCGAPLNGSDHCTVPGGCGCEQYERYCDAEYDPYEDPSEYRMCGGTELHASHELDGGRYWCEGRYAW